MDRRRRLLTTFGTIISVSNPQKFRLRREKSVHFPLYRDLKPQKFRACGGLSCHNNRVIQCFSIQNMFFGLKSPRSGENFCRAFSPRSGEIFLEVFFLYLFQHMLCLYLVDSQYIHSFYYSMFLQFELLLLLQLLIQFLKFSGLCDFSKDSFVNYI